MIKNINKELQEELKKTFDYAFDLKRPPYSSDCAGMTKEEFIDKALIFTDNILESDYHHGLMVIYNWRKDIEYWKSKR
jgi:hypothetical protein